MPFKSQFPRTFLALAALALAPVAFPRQQEAPQKGKIQVIALPRTTLEERLGRFAQSNEDREKALKEMFHESGCSDERLSEQPVKTSKIPNVICVLPGTTDSVIVVGAHFDKVEAGQGVVDNWSGASLLPSLLQSLAGTPRKHTLIFVGFTEEEKGLAGSEFYASHLSKEQLAKIRVMMNLDTLGLGPTKIWFSHSEKKLIDTTQAIGAKLGLWVQGVNADLVGDEDSTPFRKRKIATLVLHSVTQETFPILHSARDTLKAVQLDDYEDTYRLIAAVIAYLDSTLD